MIPASFDYEVAESVDHAIELLGSREEAKLLAGGHSLLPLMRLRFARPELLVDIGRLSDLSYVRDTGDRLAIGALTRHHDLAQDPLLGEHCRLVSMAAREIGDPQVRHRGTIGGSVAHGDPAGDLPAVLLALDAEFVVQGPGGERVVPAGEFFTGLFETALGPQDVLTEIRVPKLTTHARCGFVKFSRRAQDWATVGVACVVRTENGSIGDAGIGLVSMGSTPLRATAVESALRGASPDTVAQAAEAADEGTSPPSDTAASAEFRRHLARVLVRRALEEALEH
jgi:aerobic carbon-monoxide dehydrogenase medium subunit